MFYYQYYTFRVIDLMFYPLHLLEQYKNICCSKDHRISICISNFHMCAQKLLHVTMLHFKNFRLVPILHSKIKIPNQYLNL